MSNVTVVPAAPQEVHFDRHQFIKRAKAVNGKNGIAFEDYAAMHVHKPAGVQAAERLMATPEWAVNDDKLRLLLVLFLENRAGVRVPTGDLRARLNHAQKVLEAQIPTLRATMSRLDVEYVNLPRTPQNAARRRRLELEIENCGTRIALIEKGPGAILRMVTLYYRNRLDSVGVATELGCNAPVVRTTLCRLNMFWKKMNTAEGRVEYLRKNLLPEGVRVPVGRAGDLTGQRFGLLTVICRTTGTGKQGDTARWFAKCDCGKTKVASRTHLKHGSVRSCGCLRRVAAKLGGQATQKKRLIDLTGKTFGRLTVLQLSNVKGHANAFLWLCKCECGTTKLISSSCLRTSTKSCGCLNKEKRHEIAANLYKHQTRWKNAHPEAAR